MAMQPTPHMFRSDRVNASSLRSRVAALAAGAVFVAGAAGAQSLTPTFANVPYGAHPLEKVDVYLPASTGRVPAVVEIHAGGWAGGSKSLFAVYGGLIEKTFSKGVAIISVDYPLAPQDLFPAANLSCQRAVQFVRTMAPAWNIDPSRIGIVGCSSGANLAMWVAMAADAADPSSPDPVKKQSSRVQSCLSYEGPSDFTSEFYQFTTQSGHGTISPVWQFYGVGTQAAFDTLIPLSLKQLGSPRWLVQNGAGAAANAQVRFLAIFGGSSSSITSSSQLVKPNGDLHSHLQGLIMAEALKAAGNADAQVWAGPVGYVAGQGLLAADAGADWFASRLFGANVANFGYGTPGCVANQMIGTGSLPKVGNSAFNIRTYNAYPGSSGALVLTKTPLPVETDVFGIGIKLLFDPFDPAMTSIFLMADANGTATATLPIPPGPSLVGQSFSAQGLWLWNQPGVPHPCQPSAFDISSTNGLTVTFQP